MPRTPLSLPTASPEEGCLSSALSYVALVPAAGSGSRMASESGGLPKQYMPLNGRPMIWHALHTLSRVPAIARVFVVLAPGDNHWLEKEFEDIGKKLTVLRCGGDTRARSVCNGLRAIERDGFSEKTRVLVHDAARPCLSMALVERLIAEVGGSEAGGLLAVPVADTLKRVTDSDPTRVAATVARDGLWQAQTPQLFPLGSLLEALEFAPEVTDEASAIEALGLLPYLVESESTNFKVTYSRDLVLAELILRARATLPD